MSEPTSIYGTTNSQYMVPLTDGPSNVVINGDLTVTGKIINEQSKPVGQLIVFNVEAGSMQTAQLENGTIIQVISPAVQPEQPINLYDWTISLPICGTILLWAIFITIWRGHQTVEKYDLPFCNLDIPMPEVKQPKSFISNLKRLFNNADKLGKIK